MRRRRGGGDDDATLRFRRSAGRCGACASVTCSWMVPSANGGASTKGATRTGSRDSWRSGGIDDSNKLSGEIPSTLGECQLLQNLYVQNNMLSGTIPSSLSKLKGLENLDLSSNNLSGQIPQFLGNISMLYYLNLSFNSFVGEVPTFGVFANASGFSIEGNGKLCGGIPDLHLPSCSLKLSKRKHKFLVVPIVISLVGTMAILLLLYTLLSRHKRSETKNPSTPFIQGHPLISHTELVRATDGFSAANFLGSGSFGSVFKGELDDQAAQSTNPVAVKPEYFFHYLNKLLGHTGVS